MTKTDLKDCTCEECVSACKRMPGWFAPGQAEETAKALGIPWEKFRENLVVDYWCGGEDGDIYVYRPMRVAGDETYDKSNPNGVLTWSCAFNSGACIFLKDERCSIHAVKPYECRHTSCAADKKKGGPSLREKIKNMWVDQGVKTDLPE